MTMPATTFKSSIPFRRQASVSLGLTYNRLFSHSACEAFIERHNSIGVSYPGRCCNLEKFRENLNRDNTSAYLNLNSPVSRKQWMLRIVLNCCLNQNCHSRENVKLLRKIFVLDAANMMLNCYLRPRSEKR